VRTQPNDQGPPANQAFNDPLHILPDWMQFQLVMRFTDGPQPDPNPSASAQRGRKLFDTTGCALRHPPQMQTVSLPEFNLTDVVGFLRTYFTRRLLSAPWYNGRLARSGGPVSCSKQS
jgi:hypothetical protein